MLPLCRYAMLTRYLIRAARLLRAHTLRYYTYTLRLLLYCHDLPLQRRLFYMLSYDAMALSSANILCCFTMVLLSLLFISID